MIRRLTRMRPPSGNRVRTRILGGAGVLSYFTWTANSISNISTVQSTTRTLRARDVTGAVLTTYAGTVHFSSSDPIASLPSDSTLTNGVGAFSGLAIHTVGASSAGQLGNAVQTITATDTAFPSVTGSIKVTVHCGNATQFLVTTPATAVEGVAFTGTVTATDVYGNTYYFPDQSPLVIQFTSSDTYATLPSNYTFVSGDEGVHVFTSGFKLVTNGTGTITATEAVDPTITGSTTVSVVDEGVNWDSMTVNWDDPVVIWS